MRYDGVLERIKERLILSDLIGQVVPLKKRGHEFVGCCPFHQEKTPSFTVNNQKGFYHCFGCGVHGSVFDFLMHQQHMNFPEAVRHAAQIAGVDLPVFEKLQQSAHVKNEIEVVHAVLEDACVFFQEQLQISIGAEAREYLHQTRHLKPDTIVTFRIGYALASGKALQNYLVKKGYALSDVQKAGLLSSGEGAAHAYDKFRNRIMFPIQDRNNKVVGFGGRILGAGEPKYLNSPETVVFDKGKILYNLNCAIKSSQRNKALVVVEGYMDVISLFQSGYERVVAPMGTALTEDQLHLLWKYYAEPVLCFDGDVAGKRASKRAVERVLPLLKAGHSFSFIHLLDEKDPDELVRKKGVVVWEKMVEDAIPLYEVMWEYLVEQFPKKTPEQRALLEKKIRETVESIHDKDVQGFYKYDLKNRFFHWCRQSLKKIDTQQRSAFLKKIDPFLLQERVLMATILWHPKILEEVHEAFVSIDFQMPSYNNLREKILFYFHEEKKLEKEEMSTYLTLQGMDSVMQRILQADLRVHAPFIWQGQLDTIKGVWKERLDFYHTKRQESSELALAKHLLSESFSLESWSRFKELKEVFSKQEEDSKD